jgi:hypothetical protein
MVGVMHNRRRVRDSVVDVIGQREANIREKEKRERKRNGQWVLGVVM